MTKLLIDVKEIAGVIKNQGKDCGSNLLWQDDFVNALADLLEREDDCKCGHNDCCFNKQKFKELCGVK